MAETALRPRKVCEYLRALADTSRAEGAGGSRLRLKKRRRQSDNDWLDRKLAVLDAIIAVDPSPAELRPRLFELALAEPANGVTRIVADDILMDWDLAQRSQQYVDWLAAQAQKSASEEPPVDFGGPRAAPPPVD